MMAGFPWEVAVQMRKARFPSFLCCALGCFLAVDSGWTQVIKLGTVAPEGTPWHEELETVAREWKEVSRGRVKLRIYPGGVAGDEPDMLRKVRIGQLHGMAITSIGLINVVPDIEALSFPLLVENDEQLERVLERVSPRISQALFERGFQVLTWSMSGWVHFFSNTPVLTPDDLRAHKLFFWGPDAMYLKLIRDLGFQPVSLSINDLLPSLQTGLVDAFAAPPVAALSFQWFGLAKNMATIRWQPMLNVIIVSNKRWDKIPASLHPELLAIVDRAGVRLREKSTAMENKAIEAMKKHGLVVHPTSDRSHQAFKRLIDEYGVPLFVGSRFTSSMYEQVREAVGVE